jgi:hypothetical protein
MSGNLWDTGPCVTSVAGEVKTNNSASTREKTDNIETLATEIDGQGHERGDHLPPDKITIAFQKFGSQSLEEGTLLEELGIILTECT